VGQKPQITPTAQPPGGVWRNGSRAWVLLRMQFTQGQGAQQRLTQGDDVWV